MPCYSIIRNTIMKHKFKILEAIEELGFKIISNTVSTIDFKTPEGVVQLFKDNVRGTWSTTDTSNVIPILEREYNVKMITHWATNMGYKTKLHKENTEC